MLEHVVHCFSRSEAKWWKSLEEVERYGRSVCDRVVAGLVGVMVSTCMW